MENKFDKDFSAGSGSNTATNSTLGVRTSSLDSSKHNSNSSENSCAEPALVGNMAPCRSANYILSGPKGGNGLHQHLKTFCKSYECEFCGQRKLHMMKKGFALAVREHGLDVFVTLTLDHSRCGPEESEKYIKNAWNKFRTLQKREFGHNLQFIAVTEFHKNRYAHLHVLFEGYIRQSWIKKTWVAVGGGEIVDVKNADVFTANYLAKYLGKSMSEQTGRKRRAFSTSQGISIARLLKDSRQQPMNKFRFCRASEEEARYILGPSVKANILDRNKNILGFLCTKQLNPETKNQPPKN